MTLTANALALILEFEVGGGESYYNQHLKRPVWPGEASGVTIGVGYDLGYVTAEQFQQDWAALPAEDRQALATTIHLTGTAARNALPRVHDVEVPWSVGYPVFLNRTVPKFWEQTRSVFPGVESLNGDIQGALLSLVFNRGTSLAGDRRREMRDIRTAIIAGEINRIPGLIRSMIRIWVGTTIEAGMRRRRNAEAQLIERALAEGVHVIVGEEEVETLPALTKVLKRESRGEEVKTLQKALKNLGLYTGAIDGDFGPMTEKSVKAFQRRAALTVDGVVGPLTWSALQGAPPEDSAPDLNTTRDAQVEKRRALAAFAKEEAGKELKWVNGQSEAEKYLKPLRAPMHALGQIGTTPVFYDWCAAFVTYCCRNVGYDIPDAPQDFWATMALVESWKFYAQKKGIWHPKGTIVPEPGDILCFEWGDGDASLDHIGIVRAYTVGSNTIETSEGNVGNRAGNKTRPLSSVAGFIRLT